MGLLVLHVFTRRPTKHSEFSGYSFTFSRKKHKKKKRKHAHSRILIKFTASYVVIFNSMYQLDSSFHKLPGILIREQWFRWVPYKHTKHKNDNFFFIF